MNNVMSEMQSNVMAMDYASKGRRSFTRKLVLSAIEQNLLEDVLERLFDTILSSDVNSVPLTAIARRLTTRMASIVREEISVGAEGVIKTGMDILDWYANVGILKAVKKDAIEEKNGDLKKKTSWFIEILVELPNREKTIFCDPRKPYRAWTTPTRFDSGTQIPLVKRADQLNILDSYTIDKIPKIYDVINRLCRTTWEINSGLLAYANVIDETNSPLGTLASPQQLAMAYASLSNIKASKVKRKWAAKTLGSHEKRNIFDTIHDLAVEYQGDDLNFVHNLCGRGRAYALAPHLHPQGADIAKAMLVLKNKVPMDESDFKIHMANCAGEDKLTYAEREKWIDENEDKILWIGNDPVAAWDLIQEIGVDKEKKTFYQFIACAIEWANYRANPVDFKTGIMLGLDSTSSGNQILAMVSKDDAVAQYVNISATPNDRPGDLYQYVGGFVQQGLKELKLEDVSEGMQPYMNMSKIATLANLPEGSKVFRKITKRPCMVLPYSGTKYGAGQITQADQFDHGSAEVSDLNFADCTAVGAVIYDKCVEAAKKSMDILQFLRDGIDYRENEVMISWTVPQTNFLAFQLKEKMDERAVVGEVGNQKVTLTVYVATGEASKAGHKNGIAPAIVHSLDAAMLTMIISGIPEELDVGAIHDQFCVPMGNMAVLIASARDSYASIADRSMFKALCDSAFQYERELPPAGAWDVSELSETDYFIC